MFGDKRIETIFSPLNDNFMMIRNGGIKQSSEKEYKNAKGIYEKPKFWKDLVLVATGGFVIWLISVL